MNKLSEKTRKILRAIYRGAGAAAFSLTLAACSPWSNYAMYGMPDMYGMPPGIQEDVLIHGYVTTKEGIPINGIAVYIKYADKSMLLRTNLNGEFYAYVEKYETFSILFTDVDGIDNGGSFIQHEITLTLEEAEALQDNPITIQLEEVPVDVE